MFNKKYKEEIERLKAENAKLLEKTKSLEEISKEIENKKCELNNLQCQIKSVETEIFYNDINLYNPHFNYKDSDEYKEQITINYNKQKAAIQNCLAISIPQKGSVGLNGNNSSGYKIVKTFSELMLSNFNSICDNIIEKITIFNYEELKYRITEKFNKLNKNGSILGVSISDYYLKLKIEQLQLEGDKAFKKEQEKQEKERQKELLKEQEVVLKEIEAAKTKLEKERAHYEQQLEKHPSEELQNKIQEIDKQIADNDWRNAHQSAGYVYIISCDDMKPMLKIGTTRRLDPYQRLTELSNASHAFKFKCHAMIFSEDAFGLEATLHQEFAQYRVNKVNQHKEFFEVPIDKVANVLYTKYSIKDKIDLNPICEDYIASKGM